MQKFLHDSTEFLPILLQGVWLTILVTLGSLILSTILGLLWALLRVSGVRALSGVSAGLINVIRGIPIIELLFYLYFVMPDFGVTLTALQAALLGLGLSGGKLSRRHRGNRQGTDRSRADHRHRLVADHAPRGAASGGPHRAAALRQHHDHAAEGFFPGLDHHGRRARVARQADRVVDLQEHQRVHAGRADVSDHEYSADPAGPASREAGGAAMIELRNVHKSFGRLEVLRGISASVEKSEVVCIIGPSGSGKSTILRCINGLESYDAGDILVEGARVDSKGSSIVAIRTQVSMVFQRFHFFPHRTAIENVVEGPIYVKNEPRSEALERGRALLAQVGLAEKENAYPAQLSGGQQQRVAIARALAMQPKAILFDEPTSALDAELVGDVLSVMRKLADDGMTMVVVTHEMGFARDVADRVLFIDGGVVVEQGVAKSVLDQPQHARTQDFLRRVLHPL